MTFLAMVGMWPQRSSKITLQSQPDNGDGLAAITYFHACIVNADTKCGFLAAGLLLLGAAEFRFLQKFIQGPSGWGWTKFLDSAPIVVALLGIAAAAVALIWAITPRTEPPPGFSRYSFPVVAAKPVDFVPDLDAAAQRREAWIQAGALSRIAAKKFRFFRYALHAFGVSIFFLALANVLAL